jgi:preprotein translocase subunit YajC
MALIAQLIFSLLSLSIRTIVSRVFIVVFFFLFYFLGLLPRVSNGETQRQVLESLAVGSANGTMVI